MLCEVLEKERNLQNAMRVLTNKLQNLTDVKTNDVKNADDAINCLKIKLSNHVTERKAEQEGMENWFTELLYFFFYKMCFE